MTIGKRISELRKAKGYTQEYVAEQLGVSRQAVSKWEKDLTSPDTKNLIGLSQLLGVSIEYIAVGIAQRYVENMPRDVGKQQSQKHNYHTTAFAISLVVGLFLLVSFPLFGILALVASFVFLVLGIQQSRMHNYYTAAFVISFYLGLFLVMTIPLFGILVLMASAVFLVLGIPQGKTDKDA